MEGNQKIIDVLAQLRSAQILVRHLILSWHGRRNYNKKRYVTRGEMFQPSVVVQSGVETAIFAFHLTLSV